MFYAYKRGIIVCASVRVYDLIYAAAAVYAYIAVAIVLCAPRDNGIYERQFQTLLGRAGGTGRYPYGRVPWQSARRVPAETKSRAAVMRETNARSMLQHPTAYNLRFMASRPAPICRVAAFIRDMFRGKSRHNLLSSDMRYVPVAAGNKNRPERSHEYLKRRQENRQQYKSTECSFVGDFQ